MVIRVLWLGFREITLYTTALACLKMLRRYAVLLVAVLSILQSLLYYRIALVLILSKSDVSAMTSYQICSVF